MISYYILFFGISQFICGFLEFLFPDYFYSMIIKWVRSKYYFLHGIILIVSGFPLTLYSGFLSSIIFIIGIIIVFTGPVVLFYPKIIRDVFNKSENDYGIENIGNIVRTEGVLRIITGIILASAFLFA